MRLTGNDRRGARRVPDEPALLAELIALARLERDPSRVAVGLDDLATALDEIPHSINIDLATELARRPSWVIDRMTRAATIAPDVQRLAGDRAARLDTAHARLACWPAGEARSIARALGVARTYRLVAIAIDDLAACLADGTWGGQDFMALRGWRAGDGLMFHVKQLGRLRALAVTTGEPFDAAESSWQDTPRKTFRRRIAFRVLAQLEDGIDTRATIAPLRGGDPASWFKGFVGTNHVIKPDDTAALLDAFEAALLASV